MIDLNCPRCAARHAKDVLNGQKGGKARAKALTPTELSAIGKKAVEARESRKLIVQSLDVPASPSQ